MVTLLIWLGGCVLEPLHKMALRAVAGNADHPLPASECYKIDELVVGVQQGALSPREFEQQLFAFTGGKNGVSGPQSFIHPIPGAGDLLKALSLHFDLRYAVDFPREWLEKLDQQFSFFETLSPDRLVFLPGPKRGSQIGLPVKELVENLAVPLRSVIVVDPDPRRASANIRAKIQSIYYTTPGRLLRELELRGVIPALNSVG